MKTLKQFLFTLALMVVVLTSVAMPVLADPPSSPPATPALLPLPGDATSTGNNPYSNLPQVQGATADQRLDNLIITVVNNVRYLIGAVAVGLIVYSGIRMVIAQGGEEEYKTQKRNILYAIIGLAVIGFAGDLARIFNVGCLSTGKDITGMPCVAGGFLKDPNAIVRTATLFNQRTQFLITFIKYIIGSIAVFMVIRSGMRLITSQGQEEKMAEDKKSLFYGIIGLLFIIMADSVINNVFYKVDFSKYPSVGGAAPGFNPAQGVSELAGFTNIVVTIATPVAILMLLYAAFQYITSAGNEEKQGKAKRLIFAVVAGIIIMYGAFAIVSTVISGSFQGGAGTVTQPVGT